METVGWMIVAAAALAYMHTGEILPKQLQAPLPPPPSAHHEPDPRRWRHEGEQLTSSRRGNDALDIEDERVQSILMAMG